MNVAAIQLNHYFVTDLAVKANLKFDPEKDVEGRMDEFLAVPKLRPMGDEEGTSRDWQVELDIRHQPGPDVNFPYEFRLELVGFFRVSEDLRNKGDADAERRFVKVNGASILYGIAREIIRANSARGPWEGIMLPTVSFFEKVAKKSEETSQKSASAKKKRARRIQEAEK